MAYTLTFGKYKGQDIETVFRTDPSYVQWLSDKSYNAVVRQTADKVLRAARKQTAQSIRTIESALEDILDELDEQELIPRLADYQYETQMNANEATITFEIGHFLDDEGWDVLEIRSYLPREEEEEHYEGWEDAPRQNRPAATLPAPNPEAAQWHAFPDNLGEKPLNTTPITLAEAVKLLEQHLSEEN